MALTPDEELDLRATVEASWRFLFVMAGLLMEVGALRPDAMQDQLLASAALTERDAPHLDAAVRALAAAHLRKAAQRFEPSSLPPSPDEPRDA